MGSLVKCSSWDCRNKEPQKCAEIEVEIDDDDWVGCTCINLCAQCLADMMEEVE